MKKLMTLVLISAALLGCKALTTAEVSATKPRPNISIPESEKSLALSIDPSIQDAFLLPSRNGLKEVEVKGWNETLGNGFTSAFGDYYKVTNEKEKADLVLVIKRADLDFDTTAVITTGVTKGGLAMQNQAVRSRITFNMLLLNRAGKIIGRSSNTSYSKGSTTLADELSRSVGEAVETMYEAVARDMFASAK